jgi:hypothetical protein
MTTHKAAAKKAAQVTAKARVPAAAEARGSKSFERTAPGLPNLRLAQIPPAKGGEGDLPGPAAPGGDETPETGVIHPREIILRLVETLKGL